VFPYRKGFYIDKVWIFFYILFMIQFLGLRIIKKTLLPSISKYVGTTLPQTEDEVILNSPKIDLTYSQS
jgi:hypothetical protein